MKAAPWQRFLNKANHNQRLVELLEAQETDGFPDWVVVVLFYKGLHWLSAWLTQQQCPPAGFASHGATRVTVHPNPRTKPFPHLPLSRRAYAAYLEFSCLSRYDGFLDQQKMQASAQADIANAKQDLEILRQFIEGKGLKLN